ncbi:2-amino-4-hydroxy-6-hydroxymethyldihydropteridine pyrophosphokinase [Desulforamulus reducens MI-1]|uniref:2-amino-4-hydroxy-6-hydroxymethyldihydropteridine diphosphokinase n=1 Tax=Desulforamulus reducens (strain ATCC BAA-1160 / DSM 100696 / MI-1) TaxID=349161 RepID=A4J0V2_DESRM|nr:2-amino-4-hydroxy-6-hydroxymethyldihydropteridine diphosphokinase [Desulforamulus reducens]ABO48705.1 2-amino-4-hydroxy-6-hydroxymethyldihydropteridine pyrophosphokinase [Desulforamulus reducens MI-1]
MTVAYIGLGSNMGDKKAYIQSALKKLDHYTGIHLLRVASLYESAPWGYLEQDWFVNTVAEVETTLSPEKILQVLFDIERSLNRTRDIHWGPRTVDLDLLLYGSQTICFPHLQVPHPRMHERAFVLVPLAELCPNMILTQGTVMELAEKTLAEQAIRKIES